MSKTLYYKNEARQEAEKIKKFVPNYQQMGIEPIPHKMPPHPSVGRMSTPLPNVGSMQTSWNESSEEELVDDISHLDLNAPMIDNNEFITNEAMRQIGDPAVLSEHHGKVIVEAVDDEKTDLVSLLHQLNDNLYLLLLDGQAICSGPLNEIETEVNALLFGEHELCQGKNFNESDILVVKKAKIKVGVFLEG